jgi:hypothetical protein
VTNTPPPPGSYAREVAARQAGQVGAPVRPGESRWTGWVTFAATMIGIVGVFQIANGFTALFRSGTYVVGTERLVVDVDYTAWGWVHLLLGLVAIAASLGLLVGQTWARVIGIIMAVASAVTNLAFIPAYPVGSSLVIILDVLIIYVLAVHGGEARDSGY